MWQTRLTPPDEIHGGPWARDTWSPAVFSTRQLLANRAYNGRLQKDIAECAQWAIDQGIADPMRIAVFGGSFGGFSVMAQLIQKPHDYQCGINVVGVANWARTIQSWSPFWRNRPAMWRTIEDKLATCLGGRSAGFGFYQVMPR